MDVQLHLREPDDEVVVRGRVRRGDLGTAAESAASAEPAARKAWRAGKTRRARSPRTRSVWMRRPRTPSHALVLDRDHHRGWSAHEVVEVAHPAPGSRRSRPPRSIRPRSPGQSSGGSWITWPPHREVQPLPDPLDLVAHDQVAGPANADEQPVVALVASVRQRPQHAQHRRDADAAGDEDEAGRGQPVGCHRAVRPSTNTGPAPGATSVQQGGEVAERLHRELLAVGAGAADAIENGCSSNMNGDAPPRRSSGTRTDRGGTRCRRGRRRGHLR